MQLREYEIIESPASGTYGKVFIGVHTTLGMKRAIKQLHEHVRPEIIKEEALKQKDVKSPYVAQIYDFWDAESAIVMEYCPVGFDHYLRERFIQTGSRIPFDEARDHLYGILQGLDDAHNAGIIHGDLKPANVRFGDDGIPKLNDFGAAARLRSASTTLKGSTNWSAPEVLDGEPPIRESDYFSFGILAYLVLTGRHPFFTNDPSCLSSEEDNIRSRTFQPTPLHEVRTDIPRRTADLVMELLARDPPGRLRGAEALKVALTQPIEPSLEPPEAMAEPRAILTDDEVSSLQNAYTRARWLFFAAYRPQEAASLLDTFLTEFLWERFRGTGFGMLADCWSLLGFIKNSAGNFDEAVQAGTNGIAVHEQHVNSLHTRGYAQVQRGEYSAAESDIVKALNLATESRKRSQLTSLLNTIRSRLAGDAPVVDHAGRSL